MNALLEKTFVAGTGGVTKYAVVVAGTNEGEVKLPAAAGAGKIIGIAQHDASAGQEVRVMLMGVSYAVAAGNISPGDPLRIADAAGTVEAFTPGLNAVAYAVGFATEGAAQGEHFLVLLMPHIATKAS